MNISDKQLTALMDWVLSAILFSKNYDTLAAQQEAIRKRDEMYAAFGFVCDDNNRPVVPQAVPTAPALVSQQPFRHPTFCVSCGVQIYPGEQHTCAIGPATERQQAYGAAEKDPKCALIRALLDREDADMHSDKGAPEIVRLWPELKAIMEPEHCSCNICLRPIGHEPVPGEVCPGCGWRMRMTDHM